MKNIELVEELLLATSTRDLRKVDYLIQCGVDPCTQTTDGTSPIHTAALLEPPTGAKIINHMLKYGANPNTQTNDGLTPLHIAAMWGRINTINILLDYGADSAIKDCHDQSALDYAEEADEKKNDCIDALTQYRPLIKHKQRTFKTKSRKSLDMIIGKTEFDSTLHTTVTNDDTLKLIKHKKPFNHSIPILRKQSTLENELNSKTLPPDLPIFPLPTIDQTPKSKSQTKQNKKKDNIFKSIQASPIVKTTLSRFKNKSSLKESTPKSMSRLQTDNFGDSREVVNLNETLFQTCCEYLDQSIRETCQDITNIVTSTILDRTTNDSSDDTKSLDESVSSESYNCSRRNYNDNSLFDKENQSCNETFLSVFTSPHIDLYSDNSPITLRKHRRQKNVVRKRTEEAGSPFFIPKGPLFRPVSSDSPLFRPVSSDSSSSNEKLSLNNLLIDSAKTSPQQHRLINTSFNGYEPLNHNSSLSSLHTMDNTDGELIDNISKLLDENPSKYHRISSNLWDKISSSVADRGKKITFSPTKHSNTDLAIDVVDFVNGNTTRDVSVATCDLVDLHAEQTIDYSNQSATARLIDDSNQSVTARLIDYSNQSATARLIDYSNQSATGRTINDSNQSATRKSIDDNNQSITRDNISANISDLIQYYEGQNETEEERQNNSSSLLNESRKSIVEIEGLNMSGKLVKKHINFFDCTQKDFDDVETIQKRRESLQEFMNLTIDYDWKDVSQLNATEESEHSLIRVPPSIIGLTNLELRERLIKNGENPGPISTTTRSLYQRYLFKLEKCPEKLTKTETRYTDYSYEMRQVLKGTLVFPKEKFEELEQEMFSIFENPNKHTWREGTMKASFNYILMDPRVTKNLPSRAAEIPFDEQFRIFVSAIFYIGKGKNARPYEHFHEAVKSEKNDCKIKCVSSNKIAVIRDIWRAGYGVASLHVFHNIIPVEAYTREGCMIEALSLSRLTNLKRGEFYGPASTWSMRKKRLLGIHLLRKALRIYVIDGERQIRQRDISKK